MREKQVFCGLVSIYFDSSKLGTQQKQTDETSDFDPEICSNF